MSGSASNAVPKLYHSVIDDVCNQVKDAFLDDGVDEQVLQELKQAWERRFKESNVVKETEASESVAVTGGSSGNKSNHNSRSNANSSRNNRDKDSGSGNRDYNVSLNANQSQSNQHNQHHGLTNQQQVHLLGNNNVSSNITSSSPAQQQALQQQSVQGNHNVPQQQHAHQQQKQVDVQKTVNPSPQSVPQKFVFQIAGQPGNVVLTSSTGGPINFTPELLSQFGIPGGVITHPTVVQHTSNVTQNTISAGNFATFTPTNRPTLQQQQTPAQRQNRIDQIDGADDTSDEDDDDDEYRDREEDDNDDDNDEVRDEEEDGAQAEDEEPLNSEDDVSDEDPTELFETNNVVVCQYDKITRSRNKWKFHLKDGIMNLEGKDYVFTKAIGDAEW